MMIPVISVSDVFSCCQVKKPPASIGGSMIPFSNPGGGYVPAPVTLSNRCGPDGIMTPVEGPIQADATTGLVLNRPGPVGLPEANPCGAPSTSGGFGMPRFLGAANSRNDVPASSCIVPVRINNAAAPEPPTTGTGMMNAMPLAGQVPGSVQSCCTANMATGFLVVAGVLIGLYFLTRG